MIGRQNNAMLRSMMATHQRRLLMPAVRAFSDKLSTAGPAAAQGSGLQTLWQYSSAQLEKNAAKEASEAAYLDELKSFSTKPGAYSKLSEEGSSHHLQGIRKTINKIVEQEIGLVEFKNKVD
jgi:hypothetical protein